MQIYCSAMNYPKAPVYGRDTWQLNDPMSSKGSYVLTMPLFLAHFEWLSESAAKAFRDDEIAQIMGRTSDIQRKMSDAQTDPTILSPVIEAGLAEWEREKAAREGDKSKVKTPGANLPTVAMSSNGRFDLTAAVSHRIGSSDVAVFSIWHSARARLRMVANCGQTKP